MMQRWHKTQNFCSKDTDEDKVWLTTPVANGALMASQMNRQHAKEWQEASSNIAVHSRCPFPLSISLLHRLSLFLQISVSLRCSFLSFAHSFSQFAWLDFSFAFCFITLRALPLSLCLSLFFSSLYLSPYLHDEPLQNTSINYFLLDHPQSLCISAVARSTPSLSPPCSPSCHTFRVASHCRWPTVSTSLTSWLTRNALLCGKRWLLLSNGSSSLDLDFDFNWLEQLLLLLCSPSLSLSLSLLLLPHLSLSLFHLFFSLTRFGSQLLFGLYRFAFQLQILQFMSSNVPSFPPCLGQFPPPSVLFITFPRLLVFDLCSSHSWAKRKMRPLWTAPNL